MSKLNLWEVFEKLTGGFSSSQNSNDDKPTDARRLNESTDFNQPLLGDDAQNAESDKKTTPAADKNVNTYMLDLLKKHNEASVRIDEQTKNK